MVEIYAHNIKGPR